MKRSVIINALLILTAIALNLQQPSLVKTQFKGRSSGVINVTVGEKFSIPLPLFDTPWSKQSFRVFQISQQEFTGHIANNSLVQNLTEKTSDMDYLPFDCNLRQGKVFISEEMKSLRQEYSRSKNSVWQENQYIHLAFRSLLYILKAEAAEIVVYLYSEASIDKLTSYKITEFVQREEFSADLNKSPPKLALSSREDYLFLFTSLGVWQINTRTVLADLKKIQSISGFNSKNIGGVDKVLHGHDGVIIALKRLSQIFVIPQDNKGEFKKINAFKDMKEFFPQDIYMVSNTLYVLDYKKGIYVFTILAGGSFNQRSFIPFESFGGNFMLTVYQSSLFVNFNDIDGSKIVEISYDLESDQHYLVRYIKSQDYICELSIVNGIADYQGSPPRYKYSQESFDSFLFILLNFDDVQIYPFNLDPRVISQAYNAVKLKERDIRSVIHTKMDRYIIITNELIRYVRITIQKPAVTCRTRRIENSSPSKYFRLALSANVSSCEHKDHSLPKKRLFYEYCEEQISYLVHIGDPEESEFQRFMLLGVVLGVVTLFIGGLVCLMQWRNNKMVILSRLKDQILRFRNRHKRMQPFTQENVEQKDLEIEMPVVHVTSQQNN